MNGGAPMRQPVIVVGAGPGGSAAALALRRRGIPVLLLERARFPRDKVCGDVLLPGALSALQELELDLESLQCLAVPCTGCRYVTPSGRTASGLFQEPNGAPAPWWMVRRMVFDEWLARQAEAAGADLREGWCVEELLLDSDGHTTGVVARQPGGAREHLTGFVIGADGASSVVARRAGLPKPSARHVCVAARAYVELAPSDSPFLEVFTTRQTLPGCAWVAPVGDGIANVGLGLLRSDAERWHSTPRRLFEEMRSRIPALTERLGGAEIREWQGWHLPGGASGRALSGPGYLLVGDAGALIDPFTGHGIHHALVSGRLAGETAARVVTMGEFTAEHAWEYEHRCRQAFSTETRAGQRLQVLHARPELVEAALSLCSVHPGFRWLLFALVGHSAGRAELLSSGHLLRLALGWERPYRKGGVKR